MDQYEKLLAGDEQQVDDERRDAVGGQMHDRDWWQRELQAACAAKQVRLPEGIAFSGIEGGVRLELAATAADANMQEDGAAFEAWALAFRAWLRVDRVRVGWKPGAIANVPHSRRLQFRARRFAELFCEWFELEEKVGPVFVDGVHYVMNVESEPRSGDPKAAFSTELPEHDLEVAIAHDENISRSFKEAMKLEHLGRQLPVGVFQGSVSSDGAAAFFPRHHSAIDLWGLGGRTLSIFELKNSKNVKLGALSELFFYALLMRELQKRERLSFAADARGEWPYQKIPDTTAIHAYLLLPASTPSSRMGRGLFLPC